MNRAYRPILILTGVLLATGCGDEGAEPGGEGIEREAFIGAYVDLRRAALRSGSDPIAVEERERILREHGVTAEELREFVEVHGHDLEYMKAVWDSVEAILGQEPPDDSLPDAEDLPISDSLP